MKNKIISVAIISILMLVGSISSVSSDSLDGEIDVEISQTLGIVAPHLDLSNESEINLQVETVEDENETRYMVNDTITINLDIDNNSDRIFNFTLPRSIIYSAVMIRKPLLQLNLWWPIKGLLDRIMPVRKLFGSANVVDSYLGKNKTQEISLPVNYNLIGNDPANVTSENMTMYFSVMGFLPADINGFDKLPIVDIQKIDLTVNYILP